MPLQIKAPLLALLMYSFFLIIPVGCGLPPHPAESYPEPFYGKLLYQDSLLSPSSQRRESRVFESMATEVKTHFAVRPEFATAETPGDVIMSKPASAVVDSRERTLYVMDVDSMLINKYDIETGTLVDVITSARERWVPSAYGSGLRINTDENLWVYGIEKARIMNMDPDGTLGESIRFVSGDWLVGTQSGKYVKLTIGNHDHLFHTYASDGRVTASFGILSSDRPVIDGREVSGHGLGFIGQVFSDGSDTFAYIANSGGGLLSFDLDGSLRYFRALIDPSPFPGTMKMEGEDNVTTLVNEQVQSIYRSINVWNGVVYLSNFLKRERKYIVDAYAYDSGDYLYSIPVPENCSVQYVTDTYLYNYCERGLLQYPRSAPASIE